MDQEKKSQEIAESVEETLEETTKEVAETAEEITEEAAETAEEITKGAAETAEETVEGAAETAEEITEGAAETVEGTAAETVEETVATATETATEIVQEAAETADEAAEETVELQVEATAENVTETTAGPEELAYSIQHYQRQEALALAKQDVLEQLGENEREEMIKGLIGLRDPKIISFLFKQKKYSLTPEMLAFDYGNMRNRSLVCSVLSDFRKQVDWENEETRQKMFQIACNAGDGDTVEWLFKQGKVHNQEAVKLAGAQEGVFRVLLKRKATELDADTRVQILFLAATSAGADSRLASLQKAGYDFQETDTSGKQACDYLQEKIVAGKYGKNKAGEIARKRDKESLRTLTYTREMDEAREKPAISKNMIIGAVAGVVLLIAVIVGTVSVYMGGSGETVANGDTVNIDYTGYMDGEVFDGGSAEGYSLTIGSGTFIDDFEEQLIGHDVGDTVEVNVTFPEDYSAEEYQGKDATFEVKINSIESSAATSTE